MAPRAWGPDLYAGTAGNALFLARLYAATGEKLFRATAEGAARHALSLAGEIPAGGRGGFYAGQAGIAFACLDLAERLGDGRWSEAGLDLLRSLESELEIAEPQLDLIGGLAGALAVLVWSERRHPDPGLRELARRCGDKLVARARPSRGGLCWPPGLLGFCTAPRASPGPCSSFTPPKAATPSARPRWRRSATRDRSSTRRETTGRTCAARRRAFPSTGATARPGIGLARLRAFEILGDPLLKAEAEAALRGTWRDLTSARPTAPNFSLCHGFAGNAELLLHAAEVLGDQRWREAAEQVGRAGIEDFHRRGESWSSGLRTREETPSLLPGTAGTGHFYLRLYDPDALPLPS